MESFRINPAAGARRLVSVDVLRGLAVLAVLCLHIPHLPLVPGRGAGLLFLPFDLGHLGVILFLVISGFCIHLSVAKRMARGEGIACNWTAFWRRRFFRLYPPYLVAIAFSFVVLLLRYPPRFVLERYLDGTTSAVGDLATHLLMIHNLFHAYVSGLFNGAFWTLGLEEQLYLLYAVYLILRTRLSAPRTFLVTLGVTLVWLGAWVPVANGFDGCPFSWLAWPFTYWFVWILGAVAAEAHAGAISLPRWCSRRRVAWAFAGLGFALYGCQGPMLNFILGLGPWSHAVDEHSFARSLGANSWMISRVGDYLFAVAFFVLLNRWIRAERQGRLKGRASRSLAWVGTISYSLYLTHMPVIIAGEVLIRQLLPSNSPIANLLNYAFFIPACLAVAWMFFRLVESRFLNQPAAAAASAPQVNPSAAQQADPLLRKAA